MCLKLCIIAGAGPGTNGTLRNTYIAYAYDAVYTLAWGLDRLVRAGVDVRNGSALLHSIQSETDFAGLTGRVRLDSNGDRIASYSIMNVEKADGNFVVVGWTDMENFSMTKNVVFYDGTANVPDSAVRVYVDYSDAAAIAMVTLSGLGIVVTIGFTWIVMSYRKTAIMMYASPRFMMGVSIGVLIGFCNVFAWTGEPSDDMCRARPWLIVGNFVFVFGHLMIKSFRVFFVMWRGKKQIFKPIPDLLLFLCVGAYSLLFIIPTIVWTVSYPLTPTRTNSPSSNYEVNIVCRGDHDDAFLGVLLFWGGLSILVSLLLAFLIRHYHDFFSECTYVVYTIYMISITCCVVVPLLSTISDQPKGFYVILMVGLFLGNCSPLIFLFSPKLHVILFYPHLNCVPRDASGCIITSRAEGKSQVQQS